MDSTFNGFLPTEACVGCGRCCESMGCHFSPDDFKDKTFEALKAEIDKGYISIDWWIGEEGAEYFLRIRNKDAFVIDSAWIGVCMLLTETGCPFPFEKRPKGARYLKPLDNGGCKCEYSKEECKNDWIPYSDVLNKLVKHYRRQ